MREIMFRAWQDGQMCEIDMNSKVTLAYNKISGWNISATFDKYWLMGESSKKNGDFVLMQYIGLKDKNGKEIYEGDLLRVIGKMGDSSEYSFDAIYKVSPLSFEGLELHYIKLTNPEPDGVENSIPICQHPSVRFSSLTNDYVNKKYNQIAFPKTMGENRINRSCWTEHQYTNDIEIIGNIHETPELLP